MTQIKSFKDLGIAPVEIQSFIGDKIKMKKILNKEIVVYHYRIGASRFTEKGTGKVLQLQISLGQERHIVFTGSWLLMERIQKVNKDNFPFKTTIVEENENLFDFT